MFGTAALPRPPLLLANRSREILVRESLRVPGRPLGGHRNSGRSLPGGTLRRRRHPRPRRIAGRFSRGGTIARITGADDLDDDFQPPAEPITKVVNDSGQRNATPLRSTDFGELLRGSRSMRSRRYGRVRRPRASRCHVARCACLIPSCSAQAIRLGDYGRTCPELRGESSSRERDGDAGPAGRRAR